MSIGYFEALSGLQLLKQVLNSSGWFKGGSDRDAISREEFQQLIAEYTSRLMPRIRLNAAGRTSAADQPDAGEYLEEQERLSGVLAPLLFAKMDQDGNGRLEDGEIEQLHDFLVRFDRRLLIESGRGRRADPFAVLREMAAEEPPVRK